MDQIAVTRSELLARRGRLELARRGRDLLEQKRDQLMGEFRRAARRVLSPICSAGQPPQRPASGAA